MSLKPLTRFIQHEDGRSVEEQWLLWYGGGYDCSMHILTYHSALGECSDSRGNLRPFLVSWNAALHATMATHTLSTCCAGGCQLSACKLKGTCSVSVVPAVRNLAIHLLLITINLEWRWWAKTSKYPDKNSCNGAGCWVTVAREEVSHKNWLNMQPTVKQGNVASNGWFNNIFVIDF